MSVQSHNVPKVSVCMIAYNHEPYISEAIQGVLSQKTDFQVELVIGEDLSTDGTRKLCEMFQQEFPDIIRLIGREKNLGMSDNFVDTVRQCRGAFVAMCEGDDYWTDPLKLQRQVDFLEASPDYSACFHDVEVVYLNREKASHTVIADPRDEFSFSEIVAKGALIPTCSLVFRNYTEDFDNDLILLDWVLQLLLARRGKLKRMSGVMAVYRQHSGGWTNKNWTEKAYELLEITKRCRAHFGPEHYEEFDRILALDHADICFGLFQDGKIGEFCDHYKNLDGRQRLLPSRTRTALSVRYSIARIPFVPKFYSLALNRFRELRLLRRKGL